MKTLIYGAGSVGLGVASCLLESGVRVELLARPSTAVALRRLGLIRTGIFGHCHHLGDRFAVYTTTAEIRSWDYDYVLICTKSFDTEAAARELSTAGSPQCRYVLFQNGWGNAEIFTRYFSPENVFNARVITGFARRELHAVEITVHADDILIGSFQPGNEESLPELCSSITGGGIPCSVSNNIVKDLWAKMLYNCPLNSLGAVFEVSYGQLGDNSYSRELMDRIITEVFDVMLKAGYGTHWKSAADFFPVFYEKLIPPTGEHFSSTLQDLRAGKRTEIDALNGAVINLAKKLQLDVPVNTVVFNMVKFKEE